MDPMTALAALQGGMSLLGLSGAQSARQRALAERQRLMQQFANMFASEEQQYSDMSSRGLYGQAGQLGDALTSMGGALGSGLAGAGIYNSSATAGALANQGAANSQALASYAAENRYNQSRMRGSNQRALMGMQMQGNMEDRYNAEGDLAGARGGLMSALGTATQLMLRRGAVPSGRNTGTPQNGMQNSVLENPGLQIQRPLGMAGMGLGGGSLMGPSNLAKPLFKPKFAPRLSYGSL